MNINKTPTVLGFVNSLPEAGLKRVVAPEAHDVGEGKTLPRISLPTERTARKR